MRHITLAALTATCALILAACGSTVPQAATGSTHPRGWGAPPITALTLVAPQSGLRVMFDSIDLGQIPARPFAAAGYTAGRWPTYLPLRRAWPSSHTVSIAVSAADHADCLDVEPGDAAPAQVPGWIVADRRAGFAEPCVYSDWSEWASQIRPILARARIPRSSIFEWDADYHGCASSQPDAGFDATQCTDRALGRNLDESIVTLAFLRIAQPPYIAPRPRPKPAPPPVCFHRHESRAACHAARERAGRDVAAILAAQHALTTADAALRAHRCTTPYRRGACVRSGHAAAVQHQRVRWFTTNLLDTLAAN